MQEAKLAQLRELCPATSVLIDPVNDDMSYDTLESVPTMGFIASRESGRGSRTIGEWMNKDKRVVCRLAPTYILVVFWYPAILAHTLSRCLDKPIFLLRYVDPDSSGPLNRLVAFLLDEFRLCPCECAGQLDIWDFQRRERRH